MDGFTSTDRPHDVNVYDFRGNAIGTVAEIFGDASTEPISTAPKSSCAVSE
jgi:rRNA processing protein Gar1